ncbi:MAG: MBOAT family protein [Cyanobacteria bacterium P01_B01_bin.77]
MLFNSQIFICLFLPVTLIVYFVLSTFRLNTLSKGWLLATSLLFYGYWSLLHLYLLIGSVLINFLIGSAIAKIKHHRSQAKLLLVIGITINLLLIAYYKYADFFIQSVNSLSQGSLDLLNIALPLAISFYTFTQIAYLVDVYREDIPVYNLLDYSLFVTFFPQLIAGPILRHDEMIPELGRQEKFSERSFALGMSLFTLGLAKKMLIADRLSPWVAEVFTHADAVSFVEAWFGALSYTLQLYFDFSGYSDMAVGLGWLFNINLPINFNSPYKAVSIADFWRRWHITLSNFLRDYLYIPLGGNRKGALRQQGNLVLTMLLGGLWHGAGWTFVLWGGLHGLYLAINHQWRKSGIKLPGWLGWLLTFMAVVLGWVLFRASSLTEGVVLLKTLMGGNGVVLPGNLAPILSWLSPLGIDFVGTSASTALPHLSGTSSQQLATNLGTIVMLLAGVVWLPNAKTIVEKYLPSPIAAAVLGLLLTYCLFMMSQPSEFLYFQF